ncbi:MAG TPA: LuxR C-terminal-related transcriptional regulator [Rhizobiaceae bacterium]
MTAPAEAEEDDIVQSSVVERRPLFGDFALRPETQRTVTIPDAVRRCRWIAVDLNASDFALFFVSPSADRPRLTPCFDSNYPAIAEFTQRIAGGDRSGIIRHARASSVPCWWSDVGGSVSSASFETLRWASRVEPLAAGTSGLAFPVHVDRGQTGLILFLGGDIALTTEGMFEIHARCFSLFDAVARIRPGESARNPSISKREIECLKLTANGYTSDEIARLLKLSVHTANQYITNTAQKLDAVNRTHAVAKALRMGLIE